MSSVRSQKPRITTLNTTYKINIHQRHPTRRISIRDIPLATLLLSDKTQNQTISATDVASAIEEENRIRKLKEIEALRDKLVKQLKKYERD
jgi:hypothetical protein